MQEKPAGDNAASAASAEAPGCPLEGIDIDAEILSQRQAWAQTSCREHVHRYVRLIPEPATQGLLAELFESTVIAEAPTEGRTMMIYDTKTAGEASAQPWVPRPGCRRSISIDTILLWPSRILETPIYCPDDLECFVTVIHFRRLVACARARRRLLHLGL